MSSSTIRKAIGAVKDQTSIGLAKVSGNISPDLEVAILKSTSHDDELADEKHIREILNLCAYSRSYAGACVATISRRLGKTRDWIVALKSLMLIHRLLDEKVPAFHHELLCATRHGTRLLNMSDFRDDAHYSSWDHSAFVRTYALFLDQRLEYKNSILNFSPNQSDERRSEKVLDRMNQQQKMFDRFLTCRPIGLAKTNRMIIVALGPIVRESFLLYADLCETLALLLDLFGDMEYVFCVKSFEAYANAAKQIDELNAFYGWCKDAGVARFSEYPEVQRITDKLLETLREFMQNRATRPNSSLRFVEQQEEEAALVMNSIKAIPEQQVPLGDLVDLREDDETAEAQGNLIREEEGKADWELALVETASKGDGFDHLMLNNGMYDHVSDHTSFGSLSSLALLEPDGTVQKIVEDPFAASLNIPPPTYVQMYDIAKKQQLLMEEQQLWHQYTHGQVSLAKINNASYYSNPGIQYGMPNRPGAYYYLPNM